MIKREELNEVRKNIKTIFSPQIEIFVPFAEKDDPSRLNMAAKQQAQPVVSDNCNIPLLLDKEYLKLTDHSTPFCEIAEDDGIIIYKDNNVLIYYYKNLKKMVNKLIPYDKKLITYSLNKKYVINEKTFKKGDILFDYSGMDIDTKIPKIGYRANVLFAQFYGYNADDAVVISESFAKKTKITYSDKIYIPITKFWKYYRNERLKDNEEESSYLPIIDSVELDKNIIKFENIDISEHYAAELSNTSKKPSKFFIKLIEGLKNGTVKNIKVHSINNDYSNELLNIIKINDESNLDNILKEVKKFLENIDEKYIYNRGIINELYEPLSEMVKDKYQIYFNFRKIGIQPEKATELTESIFSQYYMISKIPKHYKQLLSDEFNLDSDKVDFLLEVDLEYTSSTTRGDKFTNLHAGKATAAMIIPDEIMPKDPITNKPYDIIFNTLGIPGRNNWGIMIESSISKVIKNVELEIDEMEKSIEKIKFINENFIKKYDQEYYKDTENLIKYISTQDGYESFSNDVKNKGFYLFVPNFPELSYNEIMDDFIVPFMEKFGDKVNLEKSKVLYSSDLLKWLRDNYNFIDPFDDYNDTWIEAMDAYNYILKLHHTSYSKYNSVSFTTSYSKITGQPIRGRKKGGGQHISWQSLAALLAHKENNTVLKELYTIKSDAIDEKQNFILKYIRDGEYYLKDKYNSVTKKTLNNALKMFGMRFEDEE